MSWILKTKTPTDQINCSDTQLNLKFPSYFKWQSRSSPEESNRNGLRAISVELTRNRAVNKGQAPSPLPLPQGRTTCRGQGVCWCQGLWEPPAPTPLAGWWLLSGSEGKHLGHLTASWAHFHPLAGTLFEGRLEALAWEQGWGVGGARRHSPSPHAPPHSFITTTCLSFCLCPQFMNSFLLRCLLPFHGNSRSHAEVIAGPHSAVRKRSRDPPKITEQDPQCRVGLSVWCAVY